MWASQQAYFLELERDRKLIHTQNIFLNCLSQKQNLLKPEIR